MDTLSGGDARLPDAGASAAEIVHCNMRQHIIEGVLLPGVRLLDTVVAETHGVSRNTARDALRLLARDGLAESTRNVGYSVRQLGVADVRDLFAARRIIEPGGVQQSVTASEEQLAAVEAAATHAEKLVEAGEWNRVGTAGLAFHQTLVALAGSPSLDRFFTRLSAQLRLTFSALPSEAEFQMHWIPRDREIAEFVLSGSREAAISALYAYLDEAESQVIDALRASERARGRGR